MAGRTSRLSQAPTCAGIFMYNFLHKPANRQTNLNLITWKWNLAKEKCSFKSELFDCNSHKDIPEYIKACKPNLFWPVEHDNETIQESVQSHFHLSLHLSVSDSSRGLNKKKSKSRWDNSKIEERMNMKQTKCENGRRDNRGEVRGE